MERVMPIFPVFGIRLPGIFSANGAIISAQQLVCGFGTLSLADRRICPFCFHCIQIRCRGLALRQPKCNLNSVEREPHFLISERFPAGILL
ncbi:hypothetical protein AOX56_09030 [Aeromonas sobria]|uniref:Uncharacterized protein n=1 Tax=Aeromonas sobria TaxID=646 RepID=A0A2N3ILU2_AERSO|nr:hypothetical protein AOX56_09030 [Aeromonas sobria]